MGESILKIFPVESCRCARYSHPAGADLAVEPKDRSPFSGGKRVLVDGLLTIAQARAIDAVSYAAGIACGLAIVMAHEPAVLWLGLVGVGCAFFYHAPPLKLSYRGWGEVVVALCYGPLICCGTYLVQRGSVPPDVVALSIPLGLLIVAFLWINEFPDYLADRAVNKRTLVVRLGRPRAARAFAALLGAAFLLLAGLPLLGLPRCVWLGVIGVPLAGKAARRLLECPEDTQRVVPAQAWTLQTFLLYAFGAGLGMLIC